MLNKKYLQKVRKEILNYSENRRELIKAAGDALNLSKKAIFALHRADTREAENSLATARKILGGLVKKHGKNQCLLEEGAYKAAVEEHVEASLFQQFLSGKNLGEVSGLAADSAGYVSGLADLPGELLRYAIKSATERDFKKVQQCYEAAAAIVEELVNMDLTGYHRQKFDQAKLALHKLQQVVYEVSLKAR